MVERITEARVEAGARALDPDAFADYERRLGYRASMDSEEERRRFADHYDERPEALRKARLVLAAALSTEPGEAEGWPDECATEGCGRAAAVYFQRGGVGSHYCCDCYRRIQALAASLPEDSHHA